MAEMEQRAAVFIALLCLASALANRSGQALETRADPQLNRPKVQNGTAYNAQLQKQPQFEGRCGTLDDISKRVEVCAKPLMDLLQGTVEKWPRTEDDAGKLCDSFGTAERCIRDVSRRCGKGIQRTIISTLAHSVGRARKRECGKTKLPAILKTTICLEKNQDTVKSWMANVTGRLSAIELQTREGDKKVNAICCMARDIETEIKQILEPLCAPESAVVIRLYRSVVEDIIELVCRNPRCNDYLKGYKLSLLQDFSHFISILLRIIFSLDAS